MGNEGGWGKEEKVGNGGGAGRNNKQKIVSPLSLPVHVSTCHMMQDVVAGDCTVW